MKRLGEYQKLWVDVKELIASIYDRKTLNNELFQLLHENKVNFNSTEIYNVAKKELEEYIQDFIRTVERIYKVAILNDFDIENEWDMYTVTATVYCDDVEMEFTQYLPLDFLTGIAELFPWIEVKESGLYL